MQNYTGSKLDYSEEHWNILLVSTELAISLHDLNDLFISCRSTSGVKVCQNSYIPLISSSILVGLYKLLKYCFKEPQQFSMGLNRCPSGKEALINGTNPASIIMPYLIALMVPLT